LFSKNILTFDYYHSLNLYQNIINLIYWINPRKTPKEKHKAIYSRQPYIKSLRSLYLYHNGIVKIIQEPTTEIAKVADDFVIPNITKVVSVIAIASFIVDDSNRQIFRILTNCENKQTDLDYWEKYCDN